MDPIILRELANTDLSIHVGTLGKFQRIRTTYKNKSLAIIYTMTTTTTTTKQTFLLKTKLFYYGWCYTLNLNQERCVGKNIWLSVKKSLKIFRGKNIVLGCQLGSKG